MTTDHQTPAVSPIEDGGPALTGDLIEALKEGRRAIGDHYAPHDCYATGPVTGDTYRDLIECPACSFIGKYEAVMARAALLSARKGGAA